MQDITIGTLQTDLIWEDPKANRDKIKSQLKSISKVDIIVLPEMFTTGFTMNSSIYAESMNGETMQWMISLAKEKDCLICGSIIIKENGSFYNRLLLVDKNSTINHYDKRHLFRMANEDKHFNYGDSKTTVKIKGWNICPLICYDLRFPVWSRNSNKIDLYLYIANWPKARISAWDTLLKARAIENLSYVVGVNRIGIDAKGIEYNGRSAIIDYKGDIITQHKSNKEQIIISKLSKKELTDFRERFPAHLDQDDFNLL